MFGVESGAVRQAPWHPRSASNRFTFNGKEAQTVGADFANGGSSGGSGAWSALGSLPLLDYGARMLMLRGFPQFTTADPLAEVNRDKSTFVFCSNDPVNRIDPTGMLDDWYQSKEGATLWKDGDAASIEVDGQTFDNIGSSYSAEMAGGESYVNYYQDQAISISSAPIDAENTVLNNRDISGALLSRNSPLSTGSQSRLMTSLIHKAQSNFISNSISVTGSVLSNTGTAVSTAGAAIAATGVGAGVGGSLMAIGGIASRIGSGINIGMDLKNGNYSGAFVGGVSMGIGFGVGKLGNLNSEQVNGALNLFFTPTTYSLDKAAEDSR